MKRRYIALIGLLVVVLAGCGGTSSQEASSPQATPTAAALTPDQVHEQWVDALRGNNRQAAIDLSVPELQPYVDRPLSYIQTSLTSPVLAGLQNLTINPVSEQGAGRIGRSIWKYTKKTECFQTSLALVKGVWRVANWERTPCSSS